jgi:hypothetical protein
VVQELGTDGDAPRVRTRQLVDLHAPDHSEGADVFGAVTAIATVPYAWAAHS